MRIDEIELHEFSFRLPDVAGLRYRPGAAGESPGFVLTIRADDGTAGHYRGFLFAEHAISQVRSAAPGLVGRDPLAREGIWQELWRAHSQLDHLGLGAIDVALWDLAGKHHDAAVSTLLGGYRDRVPAYASTFLADDAEDGLSSPAAYADFARACRDAGYPGFKIHAFGDPDRDLEVCRAVAEAVGDELDLMLDPVSAYRTYAEGLRVGRVLDDLGFFWYEDPLADTGQSAHATGKLADELDTPMLGGERVRGGPFASADHLAAGAADLIRADAHLDGGITGAMKIAAVAEGFGVDAELHGGGPAHLHCMAAIRNTNYFEVLTHPETDYKAPQGFLDHEEAIDDEGTIAVPDGPGLGVEIDWDFVEERRSAHAVWPA